MQAAGAAMIIPASLGLVLTTLPPDRVKRGVRVWAVSGAAAGSIGPVVGGLLTALSWRWIFVINLPIGIAAVLVTWKMIPNVRHDRTTRMPDLLGSLMIVVTIGAISLGLLNGANWGWGSAKIIGSWVAAVAAAVAFVVSTRRAAVPVIDLKMFRSRVFSASNIAIVIAAAILGIQLLGLSLFLQQSWHWSTITTGLALAPGPAAVLGASLIVPRLHQRFPIGAVVASGFVLTAAGQALMILTLRHGARNYAAAILPGWVVIGFGLGFTVPTIIGSATADLPPEQSATGSAVVNSARQFGGLFGASILVVVLGKAEVTRDPSRFYELWWVAVALCAAAVVVSLGLTPKTPTRQGRRHGSRSRRGDRQYQQLSGMSLHRPSAPGRRVMPMKRPVGALSLLADPEILSTFDTNRAVMRETRQTRTENHAYLDAPVSASHFTVPAAGYFESARQARPFVPGEGNVDSKEAR